MDCIILSRYAATKVTPDIKAKLAADETFAAAGEAFAMPSDIMVGAVVTTDASTDAR